MSYYALFTIIAAITTISGIISTSFKQKLPLIKVFITVLVAAIGSFLGARLLQISTGQGFVLTELFELDFQNFALYGGLLGGGITGFTLSRLFDLDLIKLANISVIWIGIGIAIMRIGCFIEGCCYGIDTDLFIGIHPRLFSPAHWDQLNRGTATLLSTHTVHPTQIYELLAALVASIITWKVYSRNSTNYKPFLLWVMIFTSLRFMIFFFRAPSQTYLGPDWLYPTAYILIVLSSLILYLVITPTKKAS